GPQEATKGMSSCLLLLFKQGQRTHIANWANIPAIEFQALVSKSFRRPAPTLSALGFAVCCNAASTAAKALAFVGRGEGFAAFRTEQRYKFCVQAHFG